MMQMRRVHRSCVRNVLIAIVLLGLVSVVLSASKDYYELLGIERDASTKDIQRAFKKLAHKMHPDKNQDDTKAYNKFVEINRAYEVLKDDDLRKKFDRFGEEGLKDQQEQGRWNRYESWQYYKTEFGNEGESTDVAHAAGCLDLEDRTKLAAILNKVVNVGVVDCVASTKLCKKLNIEDSTIKYYQSGKKALSSSSRSGRDELKSHKSDEVMLVYFMSGKEDHEIELRKLPCLLKHMTVGKFNCTEHQGICQQLYLGTSLPKVALFRKGGAHEIHYGRLFAQDIAAFARQSANSRLHMLGPESFPDPVTSSSELWFVDFLSPHCPPCKQMLPQLRKAAAQQTDVHFGTVDCTVHNVLCSLQNFRSYPTTMFNASKPHMNTGNKSGEKIVDFVENWFGEQMDNTSNRLIPRLKQRFPQTFSRNKFIIGPCDIIIEICDLVIGTCGIIIQTCRIIIDACVIAGVCDAVILTCNIIILTCDSIIEACDVIIEICGII